MCNEDDRNNKVLVKTDNASEIIIEEISNASEDIKNKVFQYYRLLSIRDNFTEQEKTSRIKEIFQLFRMWMGKILFL